MERENNRSHNFPSSKRERENSITPFERDLYVLRKLRQAHPRPNVSQGVLLPTYTRRINLDVQCTISTANITVPITQ